MKNTRTANSSPPAPHGQHLAPYPYDPEIGARRADYEKLAESLLHIIELETNRRPTKDAQNDPEGFWENDPKKPLQNALHDHLYLVTSTMDFFDAEFMRRFYVELRLHCDYVRYSGIRRAEARRKMQTELLIALGIGTIYATHQSQQVVAALSE